MKRLSKIIFLFFLIFFAGIYFTVKIINNSFSSEENVKTVVLTPSVLKFCISF